MNEPPGAHSLLALSSAQYIFHSFGGTLHHMIDLQVVQPMEVIPLNSATIIPGSSPLMLSVLGTDFRSVDSVTINEILAENWVVLSKNKLIVEIPVGVTSLESISVVSRQLTVTPQTQLLFQLGKKPGKVSGILRLLQLFTMNLLTTAGTDIFSPKRGGNVQKLVGRTFGKKAGGQLVSELVVAIDNTARYIIRSQAKSRSIPADERLLSVNVVNAVFSPAAGALIAVLAVNSYAGKQATAKLFL